MTPIQVLGLPLLLKLSSPLPSAYRTRLIWVDRFKTTFKGGHSQVSEHILKSKLTDCLP